MKSVLSFWLLMIALAPSASLSAVNSTFASDRKTKVGAEAADTCQTGNMQGCTSLWLISDGTSRTRSIFTQDVWPHDRSIALYRHGCDNGSAAGCFHSADVLQHRYHNGGASAGDFSGRACDMGVDLARKH